MQVLELLLLTARSLTRGPAHGNVKFILSHWVEMTFGSH